MYHLWQRGAIAGLLTGIVAAVVTIATMRVAAADLVHVEREPARHVVVRDIHGPYDGSKTYFVELAGYTKANFQPAGPIFGIYPVDPDTVRSTSELRWSVAQPIAQPAGKSAVAPPYRLVELDSTLAAVVRTTLSKAGPDGLAIIAWMARNGYVQTAPTRMEILGTNAVPGNMPVRLVVPIEARRSHLRASRS